MNKFNSNMFFNDEFFNDDFTYTTLDGETYVIKCVTNRYWDNSTGGVQNKNVADWCDIAIQKLDIGFIPQVHETLNTSTYNYKVKQIRDEDDTYMLSCEKLRRTIK